MTLKKEKKRRKSDCNNRALLLIKMSPNVTQCHPLKLTPNPSPLCVLRRGVQGVWVRAAGGTVRVQLPAGGNRSGPLPLCLLPLLTRHRLPPGQVHHGRLSLGCLLRRRTQPLPVRGE